MGGISFVLGMLALLGFLGFLAGVGSVVLAASQGRPVRNGILLAVVGLAAGLVFSVISQGVLIVQPAQVAVIFNTLSGALEEPRDSGTSVVVPVVQQYTIYDIAQREYTMSRTASEGGRTGDDAVRGRTRDGQEVLLDVSILYSISRDQVNTLHVRWQNRFEDNFVRPTARGLVREVVAGYSANEIYSEERGEMEQQIQDRLAESMEREGLTLTDVLVRDITFSEEFARSIEQARIAEQESERARLQVSRVQQEAEQQRAQAQGQRDAQVLRAEGAAQEIILRAQAEAEALRLVSEQIAANPSLIQYQYIQNLADNVGLVLVPSNSPFLFDFESLAAANPGFSAPEVPDSALDVQSPIPSTLLPEPTPTPSAE